MRGTPIALARSTRGDPQWTEMIHNGAVAIVDGDDNTVCAIGDVSAPFPTRSTAKPFQLLPFLMDGLLDHLPSASQDETRQLIAVMMSSHSGEPKHTRLVARILDAQELGAEYLQCGSHPPFDREARHAMIRAGRKANTLHCNCSGKHAAMLAVCRHHGWSLHDYHHRDHPLQQRIGHLIATLAGQNETPPHALDGCSLPSWVLPLRTTARLFSLLACPSAAAETEGRDISALLDTIFDAATNAPDFIAGTVRAGTLIMRAANGAVLAKTGADGMYAMAVAANRDFPRGLGIAFKIADGDHSSRIRAIVAHHILCQLGILDGGEELLCGRGAPADPVRRNLNGHVVGETKCLFEIARH